MEKQANKAHVIYEEAHPLIQAKKKNNFRKPTLSVLVFVSIITFFCSLTACKKESMNSMSDSKENDHFKVDKVNPNKIIHPNFNIAIDTKWKSVSQIPSPAWVSPFDGKSYTELLDFAKVFLPCLVDDYIVFYKDGTVMAFNGAVRCFPEQGETNPPGEVPGTWGYDKKTHTLTFYNIPVSGVITDLVTEVLELTRDRLVIRYTQVLPFTNTTHIVTETYERIP